MLGRYLQRLGFTYPVNWNIQFTEGEAKITISYSNKDPSLFLLHQAVLVPYVVHSEENARRIACVEQCFGASGQPLVVPGRVLVGEGVLIKMCRKRTKPRQFFLFNDILVYGNIVMNKKKYNKQHILPLEDTKIESVDDTGSLKNGWKIISPSKSFVVYAATITEKSEWIAHIRKCVSDLIAKRGVTQKSQVDSPVWVPDAEANTCMHCRKSQFTVLNRRHHCRKCGIVACNSCTNKRWLLPDQSSKPLRVCITCYNRMNSQGNRPNNAEPNLAVPEDDSGEETSDDEDDTYEKPVNSSMQSEIKPGPCNH